MGGLVAGMYVEQETDEVTDEFYAEADKETEDQSADINIAGEIYTPAAIEEMLGDWVTDQTSPPTKGDQLGPVAPLRQNTNTVSSELLIHISDRDEDATTTQEEGRVLTSCRSSLTLLSLRLLYWKREWQVSKNSSIPRLPGTGQCQRNLNSLTQS